MAENRSDDAFAVPPHKARFYDAEAREKRLQRAVNRAQGTDMLSISRRIEPSRVDLPQEGGFKVPTRMRRRSCTWRPESELYRIEMWRSEILDTIDRRIAGYYEATGPEHQTVKVVESQCKSSQQEMVAGSIDQKETESRSHEKCTTGLCTAGAHACKEHGCSSAPTGLLTASQRALHIGEIVEKVLHYAGPAAEYTALNVCQVWRAAATALILDLQRTPFGLARRLDPVRYGDFLSPKALQLSRTWTNVTKKEIDDTTEQVNLALRRLWTTGKRDIILYIPARISQASELDPDIVRDIDILYSRQLLKPLRYDVPLAVQRLSQPTIPEAKRWLDLTQFRLNEHFATLFPGRFQEFNGCYEITLKSHSDPTQQVIDHDIISSAAFRLLKDTFVTEPPITKLALGVRIPTTNASWIQEVQPRGEVTESDGIRIETLISALESRARVATALWRECAEELRNSVVENAPDADYWCVCGQPSIVVHLAWHERNALIEPWPENSLQKAGFTSGLRHEDRCKRRNQWIDRDLTEHGQEATQEPMDAVRREMYSIGLQ